MRILGIAFLLLITGCAGIPSITDSCTTDFMETFGECREEAEVVTLPASQRLANLPPADAKPIVAVYSFKDLTGQKENDKKLQPLLFAGIIIDGGIIGYDTNIETGGRGARYLGIGSSVQYKRDSVIVSLRATSTLTGEILLNVQTKKSILSVGGGYDVFRFVDMDTKLVEIEDGSGFNESVTYATRAAIEEAVLELIYQGHDRGYWIIKDGHRHPHQHDGINEKHLIKGEENEHE